VRPEELRRRLEAAHARLLLAISGVTEEQFKRRPAATPDDPEPWCIAEVLAHVLGAVRLWSERIKRALEHDDAAIVPSAPEEHERVARSGRGAPVPQLVHGLLAGRREVEKLIERSITGEGEFLARSTWHPRLGEHLDLAWMFEKIVGHAEEHALDIEERRLKVGAPPVASRPSGGATR